MKDWLSDALCRVSTGGGFATRELWTNDEEALFNYMRPIIVTGIDEIINRNDLADRTVFITLPPIPDHNRLPEKELTRKFNEALPGILGGIFDAISVGLKNIGQTHLDHLPRMADFALWVTAAEPALPWKKGDFLKVYNDKRKALIENALDNDAVASRLKGWFREKTDVWEGSMSALLAELESDMDENHMKGWPKDGRGLSQRLRRSSNFLRRVGIDISFKRNKKGRVVMVSEIEEEGDAKGDAKSKGDEKCEGENKCASSPKAPNHGENDAGDANDGVVTNNSLLTAYIPLRGEKREQQQETDRKGSQKSVTSVLASSKCNYNNQPRKVSPEVCEWHLEENDPFCLKCKEG